MTMTDAGLQQEVKALTDRIHERLAAAEDESGGSSRIVLNIPDEWMLLAAWLEMRHRMRSAGRHGPSRVSIEALSARTVRSLARDYISSMLDSDFNLELHDLCTGGHPFLTHPPEPPRGAVDHPDDGLPF